MPEPGLEGPHSAKRRRPAERQAEDLICNPVPTPKSTPPPTPSGDVSYSRASTKPSLGPLDSGRKRDGARTPRPSPNDLHDEEDGGDSAHSRRIGEELLHSSRRSISSSEGVEGEQYFGPDSERCDENREGSGREIGESREDKLNQDDEVSRRPPAKTSQPRKRSDRPFREKRHDPSRTALRLQGSSTMSTRASRQVTSSQLPQLYQPRIDNGPRSCYPRTSSSGIKAGDETNINHGPNLDMSYQITDLTLCTVPNGSSIVTAIVRYRDSKCSLDPAALGHKFLGGDGKVIRMTQLSPDSWMLLGYRYDDNASSPCTRGSSNADWMSSFHSDAANNKIVHLEDDWDGEGENEEESTQEYSKRTHRPWLESDEVRLLSYKDKQGIKWEDICKRFPDRSEGAVKLRYYTLQKKVSRGYFDL